MLSNRALNPPIKIYLHDETEILLEVALNTNNLKPNPSYVLQFLVKNVNQIITKYRNPQYFRNLK